MGRTRGSTKAGRGRGQTVRGGKSLGGGNGRPAKQLISFTNAATKPVFNSADFVNTDGISGDGAASHGPADCRVYGVKAYKPVGRNPSEPTVHIDPTRHLSYKMNVGEIRGCGSNRLCSHWYKHLPKSVQDRIVHAGFGEFVKCLVTTGRRDRQLVIALAERWWDTTHTFHFDNIGEMTMTPTDFSAITGVQVSGRPLEYDMQAHTKHRELLQFFGKRLADIAKPTMTYTEILDAHADWEPTSADDVDRLTRVFILCLIGSTLCAGRTNTLNLYYLPCLKNFDEIQTFNWGGAALSCLYRNMDSLSRGKSGSIGGFWRAWELWACEYLMPLALFRPLHGPNMWPHATCWFGAPDIRECPHSLEDFRVTLRYLTVDKIVTNPWGTDTSKVPDYVKNSIATTQRRVLLQGPAGYAWYLGERVSIQSLGTVQQRVPVLPPRTMLRDYRLDKTDINDGLWGWEASTCLMDEDNDYTTYRREYLVYRHQPIEAFKEDSRRGSVPIKNIKPIEVSTISMPQRMINVVGRESGQCDMIEIPKGEKTNLLPLPSDVTCVDAKQVAKLLDIIAGQNSIIFDLCMDANKEFRAKRNLEEKYASRPTLQSSPTIHVDKSGHRNKMSPLGEECFCYESDEDDNDDDGMYTDGDDVIGDGEKDDRVEDVNEYDNGDKDDGVTDVDANSDRW